MPELNVIDYGIIGIIGASMIIGLLRGFVREAMSLLTWICALVFASLFYEELAVHFTGISTPWIQSLLAFIVLVLVMLILGGLINYLISKFISSTKFSLPDRVIGIGFGFARGAFIVAVILLFNPMGLSKKPLGKDSAFLSKFQPVALWIEERLPEDFFKFPENLREKTHPEKAVSIEALSQTTPLPENAPMDLSVNNDSE